MTIDNKTTWVITANSSEAYCYATKYLGRDINLVKEFFNPNMRKKTHDLVTDKPGHYQSNEGPSTAHGSYADPTDPKEVEAQKFARLLAEELDKARINHDFDHLIVIAPPHFHGLLNQHLNRHVLNLVTHQIEKDYTKLSMGEIKSYLEELPRPSR